MILYIRYKIAIMYNTLNKASNIIIPSNALHPKMSLIVTECATKRQRKLAKGFRLNVSS